MLSWLLRSRSEEKLKETKTVVTVTAINGLLKQIPGCENCEEDDVSSWLDCDADDSGFQLMSDDEIIAQERKPNSDDDNSEKDEN
ncbi:hypothetical protein AVEN_12320-1 [Araneus ventricosus]|uniref:Uncharacterized protein n=1 Tax=Araneus ventricosus TaxID=182803 RepID=A0A4Y2A7F7_ARAVE|nr:hypothetical protein AVEN_12320-1 [Araneus ventricosus]